MNWIENSALKKKKTVHCQFYNWKEKISQYKEAVWFMQKVHVRQNPTKIDSNVMNSYNLHWIAVGSKGRPNLTLWVGYLLAIVFGAYFNFFLRDSLSVKKKKIEKIEHSHSIFVKIRSDDIYHTWHSTQYILALC